MYIFCRLYFCLLYSSLEKPLNALGAFERKFFLNNKYSYPHNSNNKNNNMIMLMIILIIINMAFFNN